MKNQGVEIFRQNKSLILETWTNLQLEDPELGVEQRSGGDLRIQSEQLLNAFINDLSDESMDFPTAHSFESVVEVLNSISLSWAKQGFSPRETGIFVLSLKEALNSILQTEIRDYYALNIQTQKVGKIIDSFGMTIFETFIKGREDTILRQTDELSELSTPVIQVWQGVLALPIIGTLDSARTQIVMESLLQKIVETGSNVAILDISGVPAVDSLVAQHLIKTVSATRLMGGECIISGIRPEIAHTVVQLGIDLSNVITKATMASALRTAFSMQRMMVQKKVRD